MTWDARPRDPQEQRGFDAIGAMIKRRRHALGWSQRTLEARSGIDQTVISRLENGKQYGLRWSRFAKLVDALGGLDGLPAGPQWPGSDGGDSGKRIVGTRTVARPPVLWIDLGSGLDYDGGPEG